MDDTSGPGRPPKVRRVIDEYGLDGLGDELERRWTASGDERMSLRALADYLNEELLAEAMADAGIQPVEGEVENHYQLLTGEDVSRGDYTRIRRRLERDGVDVDRLEDDFVTYQAVRTYLTEHRNAEYEAESRDRAAVEADSIQRLQGRVASVVDSKLEQLDSTGDIALGDSQTFVEITVHCVECGERLEVGEFLERGGCNCRKHRK
jgi:hypothetical protein